jgi:hypothetical protein
MKWEKSKDKAHTSFQAESDVTEWSQLPKVLAEWLKVLFHQISLLPAKYEWNRISMEVWLDSGRLIAYPALGSYETGSWPISVEIDIPFLSTELDGIPECDEYESQVSSLEYSVWNAVREACRDREVKQLYNQLKKQHVFTVWRQSADDLSTANQFLL